MEGAASGARAAAGLSVSTSVPIDKGHVFPSREAARTAAETELTAAGRAIKNGPFKSDDLGPSLTIQEFFSRKYSSFYMQRIS